jgi:hypothetical protein
MATTKTDIHVGDIGTIFRVTIVDGSSIVPLSGASIMSILFEKPDGTVVTVSGEWTTDGSDGKIECASYEGLLDMDGTWEIGAIIVTNEGRWEATSQSFKVRGGLT